MKQYTRLLIILLTRSAVVLATYASKTTALIPQADGSAGISTVDDETTSAGALSLLGRFGGSAAAVAGPPERLLLGLGRSLVILDTSDPQHIKQLGMVPVEYPVEDIAIQGDLAYVAANRLLIIDITQPAQAEILSITAGGAHSVSVDGQRAAVGLSDGKIHILDISDPRHTRTQLRIPSRYAYPPVVEDIVDLALTTEFAYAVEYACFEILDFYECTNFLLAVDLTQDVPEVIEIADVNGSAVTIAGQQAFVTDDGLLILDISTPLEPSEIGRLSTGTFPGGIWSSGQFVHLVDSAGLRYIDVSAAANPVQKALIATPGEATAVTVNDDLAYVAAGVGGLQIIDPAGTKGEEIEGVFATVGRIFDAALDENYAYLVAEGSHGTGLYIVDRMAGNLLLAGTYIPTDLLALQVAVSGDVLLFNGQVINVSDRTDPQPTAVYPLPAGAGSRSLVMSDTLAFVGGSDSLNIIDLENPNDPQLLATVDQLMASGVSAANHTVYTTKFYDIDGGIWTVDVTDPHNPTPYGPFDINYIDDMAARDKTLYTANGFGDGLTAYHFDRADEAPEVVYENTSYGPESLAVSDGQLYLSDYDFLRVLDISRPGQPGELGAVRAPGQPGYGFQLTASGNSLASYQESIASTGLTLYDYRPYRAFLPAVKHPSEPIDALWQTITRSGWPAANAEQIWERWVPIMDDQPQWVEAGPWYPASFTVVCLSVLGSLSGL